MTNLKTSLFAGVLIAIAGWGFLANPVLGMFLFCVGLIAVVKYQTRLYTGTAGFLSSWRDLPSLLLILLGNIAGCLAVASVALVSPLPLGEAAIKVISSRLAVGWWRTGLLAIGCGLLMSLAVDFARKNRDFSDWLPLLFAVPAFILCGFPHCVADAFYCSVYLFSASDIPWLSLAAYYGAIVLGNFIGCNIYRLFTIKKSES
jgi:formate/nitrite transporter FocA (FNT family)